MQKLERMFAENKRIFAEICEINWVIIVRDFNFLLDWDCYYAKGLDEVESDKSVQESFLM